MRTRSQIALAVAGCLLVTIGSTTVRASTTGKSEVVAPAAQTQPTEDWRTTAITHEEKVVVLTGSKLPRVIHRVGRITDAAFPLTVIDRAAIERSGASTAVDVLRMDPAVRIRTGF